VADMKEGVSIYDSWAFCQGEGWQERENNNRLFLVFITSAIGGDPHGPRFGREKKKKKKKETEAS